MNNPDFPTNRHGLVNGSYIEVVHQDVTRQMGLEIGKQIPLGWTGEYVRHGGFTWDVDQLCDEIDAGYWKVVGSKRVDFTNRAEDMAFGLFCGP